MLPTHQVSRLTLIASICAFVLAGCRLESSPPGNLANSQQPSTPDRASRTLKIMPLGDSITDGYGVPGGYRIYLWQDLAERGYNVDFVGSLQNGPSELPDKDHEGHSGWRIRDIRSQIAAWLQQAQPDLILLIIGSNDILKNDTPETAPDRLRSLLDEIFARVPQAKIVVGSIPPMADPARNRQVRDYNAALKSAIAQQKEQGKQVFLVDVYAAIDLNDLPDGLHPNARGHKKIAAVWDKALATLLKTSN
jgi:acyl-CoA thioesterase I